MALGLCSLPIAPLLAILPARFSRPAILLLALFAPSGFDLLFPLGGSSSASSFDCTRCKPGASARRCEDFFARSLVRLPFEPGNYSFILSQILSRLAQFDDATLCAGDGGVCRLSFCGGDNWRRSAAWARETRWVVHVCDGRSANRSGGGPAQECR